MVVKMVALMAVLMVELKVLKMVVKTDWKDLKMAGLKGLAFEASELVVQMVANTVEMKVENLVDQMES